MNLDVTPLVAISVFNGTVHVVSGYKFTSDVERELEAVANKIAVQLGFGVARVQFPKFRSH